MEFAFFHRLGIGRDCHYNRGSCYNSCNRGSSDNNSFSGRCYISSKN